MQHQGFDQERVFLCKKAGNTKEEIGTKIFFKSDTVNNYRQVTGMVTGENFAFFIYRHFVEIL